MVAISREGIQGLTDRLISQGKKKKAENLVACFLQLFEKDEPLQAEAVTEWHEDITAIPAEHIKLCLEEALSEGWIVQKGEELFITEKGLIKAEEAIPLSGDVG